ncbi:MAG TPA: hypothetical protein VFO77_03435 [Actinoplanes sp.]|nr:hypothetical protein [Actinoplanes sp.]
MTDGTCHWPAGDDRLPDDDEPTVMGMDERGTWLQLAATLVTATAYLVVVVPRVLSRPVAEVSWVQPMLWAIGGSIAAVILGAILAGIGGALVLTLRGRDVDSELHSDRRDRDIERYARRRTYWLLGLAAGGALILAMLDADTFWIGNFVYLTVAVESVLQSTIKIRAYRRGFTL